MSEQVINSTFLFKKIFSKDKLGLVCLCLALLLSLGYPISASIPTFLQIPSRPINMAFRGFYLIMSFYLIIGAAAHSFKGKYPIPIGGWFMIGFWMLYSIRLIYDQSFRGIAFKGDPNFVYLFAFGSCMIPMFAIILTGRFVELKRILKYTYGIVLLSNLLIIGLLIHATGTISPDILMARASLVVEIDGEKTQYVINPITVSYYGQVLALLSLFFLLIKKKVKYRLPFFIGFLLGLGLIVLGASRGPLLTFVLLMIVIFFVHIKRAKFSVLYNLRLLTGLSLFIAFIVIKILPFIANNNIVLIGRMQQLLESGGTTNMDTRPLAFQGAWNQFIENPVFGDQYIGAFDGFYPHNIYLEVLMALGTVGGVLFLGMFFSCLKKMFQLFFHFQEESFASCIIVLGILIAYVTSGSIFQGTNYWNWIAFYLSVRFFVKSPQIS